MALNSQRTFRAQSLRYPLSNRRVYEIFEPSSEIKETAEAYFLHVKLPGYTIIRPKIALEDASKKLRITGERPIADDKWEKFDQTYHVPENSDAEKLEAKFEQEILILKMQKKPISPSQVVAPKQELEKNQPYPLSNEDLDETKVEKVQETIPPTQSTTKFEEPTQDMKSDSPQTQSIEKNTQEAINDDTLSQIAKEAISNNEPQKGLQELEQKPTFKDTTKTHIDDEKDKQEFEPKPTFKDSTKEHIDEKDNQEFESKPTFKDTTKTQIDEKAHQEFVSKPTLKEITKTQIDEKAQKSQEAFEKKPTLLQRIITQIYEKAQKSQEELEEKATSIERTKTQIDVKAQKGQEEFEKKPTFTERTKTQIDEKDQKGQVEFETKPIVTERTKTQKDEKVKKGQEEFEPNPTSIEKSQTETNEKPQKVQEEFEPKPIEKLNTIEKLEEKIIRNSVKKERMLEKEESEDKKEKPYESIKAMIDVKNQNLQENEIEKEKLPAPKVTENEKESCSITTPKQEEKNGVGKLAIASSQLVTRMADGKWRGNERNLVKNVGVAVLVIAAFGAYISYRFSS